MTPRTTSHPSLTSVSAVLLPLACTLLYLLVAGGGALPTQAQNVRLNIHGSSWHVNSQNDNPWTFGGGSEMAWTRGSWRYGALTGGYYNSIWNLTLYIGLAGSYEINDWFGVGLCALAATGYNRQVCYPNALGQKTCFKLEWARPVTVTPLPYVSVGNRMKVRIAGSSSLESGMIHLLLSVPLRRY